MKRISLLSIVLLLIWSQAAYSQYEMYGCIPAGQGDQNRPYILFGKGGGGCMTPQQINRMHFGLENVLSTFTVCKALEDDRFLCDLGYPMVRAFGHQVVIGNCGNNVPTLEPGNINTIHFTREVVFEEVEIGNGAWFEIIPNGFVCF